MKIQKTELAAKLNKIKGVVPKRSTMAVLEGILVKEGYLIAHNMEMTVKAKIEGMGDECFIIPNRAFDLINNLPDGEIEILAGTDNVITIKLDKIKNTYQAMDPLQFPAPVELDGENEMTISAEMLLESMKHVSYAVPAQHSNAMMTAMCLRASDGHLDFVGMDSHMIAWDRVDYEGEFELLLPKNTVDKLKSLGLSGNVQIRYGKTGAVFITEEFEVYTRLVNGEYFKYQTLFKEMPLRTAVSRAELLDAITRARMCTEERQSVKFELKGNSLSLSIKDRITDYNETVDLREKISEALTIGFNARLVFETLKAFECDSVGISFGGSKMPMIIEAEDSNMTAMVMPVVLPGME